MAKHDAGAEVRRWLKKKLGNPIMPSKEYNQIKALEDEERKDMALQELQERGEDYDTRVHRVNYGQGR